MTTMHPDDAAYARDVEERQAAAEEAEPGFPDPEPTPNLPAPLGDASGALDVDALRGMAPALRANLVDALRLSARQVREARGTVVVEEDVYDLTRRLVDASEVLRTFSSAFTEAAKEADDLAEEEALCVPGAESDGVLLATLFVPDGAGQRIAIRPDYASGTSTWDVDTLIAWVAEQVVADEGRKPDPDMMNEEEEPGEVPLWSNDEAVSLVRDGIDKLLRLGSYSPGAKAIEAERKRLAGLQRDADAAILRQVRSVGPRTYKGAKITREETK